MSNISGEDLLAVIYGDLAALETTFKNIAQNEFSKVSNEYSDNEDEYKATMAAIDSVQAKISIEGASVKLEFIFGGNEAWVETMDEGQGVPVLGGDGGIVTYPDGHTEPSMVPEQFWGTPYPEGAEPPSHIMENIRTISEPILREQIETLLHSDAVVAVVKAFITSNLQLGGEQ